MNVIQWHYVDLTLPHRLSRLASAYFSLKSHREGTYHLQGYAEFEKQVSLAAVRKHFGDGVFAQIARGTPDQCIRYCSKEDSRVDGGETVRFGKPMEINEKGGTSGSRTDWKDAIEMLDANALPVTVIRKHPHMLPCVRALHHFRTEILREQVRHRKTEVLVLWDLS